MDAREFKARTKSLAVEIMALAESIDRSRSGNVVANQIMRSATSVAANYRAACRGRTPVEMAAKLGIVEEEADETIFWLEIAAETKLVPEDKARELISKMNEILAMTVASIRTLRERTKGKSPGFSTTKQPTAEN